MNIQWYPGHMTKTRRQMEEDVKFVDMVAEVVDARIPISSRNPDIDSMVGDRPRMIIFNRADQADPKVTAQWMAWFKQKGYAVLETDAKSGKGVNQFSNVVKQALREKIEAWRAKGQVGRPVRVMVVGVPNVGKSTFINTFAGSARAKAADRPGVTKGKQWVSTEKFDLLDMPGVLWKKFDSKTIASNLAFIGSIKDDILDVEELAMNLLDEVRRNYPELVASRYKLDAEALALPPYELMEAIGRKRGLLVRGGEVNTERCAIMLVDEFRACKWGRITLERPPRREEPEQPEGEDEA